LEEIVLEVEISKGIKSTEEGRVYSADVVETERMKKKIGKYL
jgi:hypothetical protein